MESWRKVWREGAVPLLSKAALECLRKALADDDPRLLQGSTTPPPLYCVQDWPVEAACAFGFIGWQVEGIDTVREVEEYFGRMCYAIDQKFNEPATSRWFLNWFDETPREEMRRELLPEVERAITEIQRESCQASEATGPAQTAAG